MSSRKKLLEVLAVELERPRHLTPRVLNYIEQTYNVEHDALGSFFADRLSDLEDYEIDLVLSPLFTPKLADQAIFAQLLGSESIAVTEWPRLIEQLQRRPTWAQLDSGMMTHAVPLREVTIQRYVFRLRLDGSFSEDIAVLIDRAPSAEHPLLKAIARRQIWEKSGRDQVLDRYLAGSWSRGVYAIADTVALLDVVEMVKPADLAHLLSWIPKRRDVLREQIDSGMRQFISQSVQEMYGGYDQRDPTDARKAREAELAFLTRLEQIL